MAAQQTVAICFGSETLACQYPNISLTNLSYFSDLCLSTEEEENQIGLGVALGILGSIGINLGNNLQALGLNTQAKELADHVADLDAKGYADELDKGENAEVPKMSKFSRGNVIFGCGWVIFVSASLINFAAFAFAPASILAPLEAIQVVMQLFNGRLFFGKKISLAAFGATILTVGGVIGVVFSVPPKVYSFSMSQVIALWSEPLWNVYLLAVLSVSASMHAVHVMYARAEAKGKPLWKSSAVTPVSYAVSGSIIGALSVSQAKVTSEMVSLLLCWINIFAEPFLYMTLIMLTAFGGIWLWRMTAALGLYDPNFIIPLLQSCYIAFATISGGVFFQEFEAMANVDPNAPNFLDRFLKA